MVDRGRLLTLIIGLLLAVSAFLLVNESFRPLSLQWRIEGRDGSHTFVLASREPLFLEYDLIVRSPGQERPAVVVTLNDRAVTIPRASAAYLAAGANIPLPFEAIREGTNVLRVRIEGPATSTFEMRGRLHNYFGIAPDFPRAVVVADEAVASRHQITSASALAARAFLLTVLCVAGVWLLGAIPPQPTGRWPKAHLLATVLGPFAALAYGAARPLHLWLFPETMVLLAIVPWLIVLGTSRMLTRPRLALAVVAPIAITLVALEGTLRLVNAVRPLYVFYSESGDRFRGQPGERFFDATFNSRGFNDAEHNLTRPADVAYRVVALGDSFAVGVVPQRDNFLTQLESRLSADRRVEVINLGVSGTGPLDYLSLLADEGLAYGPDLVLVNFFVGNDFESRQPRWHERSYLLTLARALWRLGRTPAVTTLAGGSHTVYDDNGPSLGTDAFMEIQVDRSWVYERGSTRFAAAVDRAARYVRQMRDVARRGGADVLVALIPDETQIDAALRAKVSEARRLPDARFDWQQPNRLLARALAGADIEVLDLLPALTAAARQGRVYKPADTHWNVAGNRVAAATIAQALAPRLRAAAGR